MAFVTAPDFPIKAITWTLDRPSQVNVSAWTGTRTVIANPWHGKWTAHVELATQQGEDNFRAIRSFFARCKGSLNTFRLYATAGAQNANTGVTVAATVAAGVTTMTIAGAATPLLDGQFFTVNGQLCCCTADQSGATLAFEPPLRAAATSGTVVVTSRPYALVYLSASSFAWQVSSWRQFGLTFDVDEAVGEPDLTPPIELVAPSNTVLPVVSGTTVIGETLTTTDGSWINTPATYAYQWKRNGSAIGSAISNSYVQVEADSTATITCTVTASNVAGNTPATSAGVGPVFSPTSLFGGSDKGFIYDFTDKSKLYQSSGGGTPVNAVNDPIGYATDLSGKGNHATQSTAGSRPLWDGASAVADGTKSMAIPAIDLTGGSKVTIIACVRVNVSGNHAAYAHGGSSVGDFMLATLSGSGNFWTARGFGSVEYDSQNSRGGLSPSFRVATALLDKSAATAILQSTARINGEAYGTTVTSGPSTTGTLSNSTGQLFAAYFGNMTGEIARIIVINRALSTADLFNAEYWVGRGAGLALISELPPAGNVYYNLISSYGQSLATGSQSLPVLSSTTRFSDKMFTSGVHVIANGLDYSTLIPLVESTATESATPEGETPASGMAEMIHEQGSLNPFIGVTNGFPGLAIASLQSGTSNYNYFVASVTQGMRRSREAFQHFKVRAFPWMQGEADGSNASYAANLNTLRSSLDTDIRAITGQTENVWCLTYQLDRAKIGLAHLAASDTYSNIRVAFPAYFLAHYSDDVHLANTGSKIAGAYFGLAYKAIIIDGNTSWQPLRIQSHSRSGTSVDLTYNPVGSLALDTSIVAAQTTSGFRLFQADGTTPMTINSVTLVGANVVRVTASATIPVNAVLRLGFSDPTDHTAGIAKTNLRDSQGSTIIFNGGGLNYPMHNWAVLEQRTLT